MNKLQLLITEKLSMGKSYRDIEKETGVNHNSISAYHKGSIPHGKNLAILGKYFRVDFWELVEEKKPASSAVHTSGFTELDEVAARRFGYFDIPEEQRAAILHNAVQRYYEMVQSPRRHFKHSLPIMARAPVLELLPRQQRLPSLHHLSFPAPLFCRHRLIALPRSEKQIKSMLLPCKANHLSWWCRW